jgi:hypothetical protein
LLLKFRFRIEVFNFASRHSELRTVKWRINLSKYGAHLQDILLLFMFIITEDLTLSQKRWMISLLIMNGIKAFIVNNEMLKFIL